ncbi:MAG: nucleotidyltransferase domain-containing protein [Acidobacteriia bacterium]|nr:nucleotidyltransferase domain-containing protein [Terriglobia bacterium]
MSRLQEILAELRRLYESTYGDRLVKLVLFGSQARNDAEPDSDIDVMVVLRGQVTAAEERRVTDDAVSRLCLKYDVLISPVYVSEERFVKGGSPLLLNVRREGVAV